MDGGHTGPLRPNEAMEVGIRLLGLNGATEKGCGGRDEAMEAGIRPLRLNKVRMRLNEAAEAK